MTPIEKEEPGSPAVASQAARYFVATAVSRLLQFAYFLLVVRALDAADRGRYSLTLALASIAAMVMSLGYEEAIVRAIAGGRPTDRARILRTALVSKGALGAAILALMVALGAWAWRGDAKAPLLALFGLSVFLESLLGCYLSLFQAVRRLERNSLLMAGGSLLTLAGGGLVVWNGWGVVAFASVVVAVQGARLLVAWRWGRRWAPGPARFDPVEGGRLWRASATIGLVGLLGLLFVWADTLVLGLVAGDAALGEYWPARTLVGHAGLVPTALRTAVFPLFVGLAASGPVALGVFYGRCCQVLLAAAVPIAAGVCFLAPDLAVLLFGANRSSALAGYMRILPWLVPFSFLQSLCALALVAQGRERRLLAPQVFVTAAFGGALWWAARAGGGAGVAWVTLVATAMNFIVFLPLLRDMRVPWGRVLAGPLAAGAVAGAVFAAPFPWWGRGGLFLAVYAAMLSRLGIVRGGWRTFLGEVVGWKRTV